MSTEKTLKTTGAMILKMESGELVRTRREDPFPEGVHSIQRLGSVSGELDPHGDQPFRGPIIQPAPSDIIFFLNSEGEVGWGVNFHLLAGVEVVGVYFTRRLKRDYSGWKGESRVLADHGGEVSRFVEHFENYVLNNRRT